MASLVHAPHHDAGKTSLHELTAALDALQRSAGDADGRARCEGLGRKATDMAQLLDTAIIRSPGLSAALAGPPKSAGDVARAQALESAVKSVNAAMMHTLHPVLREVLVPGIAALNANMQPPQPAANLEALNANLVDAIARLLGAPHATSKIFQHLGSALNKGFPAVPSAMRVACCHKLLAAILPVVRHTFTVRCINPGPGGSLGPVLKEVGGQHGLFTAMTNLTGHVMIEVPTGLVDKEVRHRIHERVLGAMHRYHQRAVGSSAEQHHVRCVAAIRGVLEDELATNTEVDVAAVWAAVDGVLRQYLKPEWLHPRGECIDASTHVFVRCHGVFQAAVMLAKPGSCDPASVVIGPDHPKDHLNPWAPPDTVVFERFTALATRALGFFRERATLTSPVLPGAQALQDLLFWLATYRNAARLTFHNGLPTDPRPVPHLFAAPCMLTGCVLAMDPTTGSLTPPLLRPYRLPSSTLRRLACERMHAVEVYHLSEALPDML